MDSLSRNIRKGLIWNSFRQLAKYGLQFLSIVILARLLSPYDYGVIGIITIFISVADILIDSGLAGAIIKKQNARPIDYSTLFIYNISVSLILYLIYFIIAPILNNIYKINILAELLRLYSVVILIHAIVIVPRTKMTKRFEFKTLSLIDTFSNFVGLFVAIVLAYLGFGAVSLVWQHIVYTLMSTLLILYFSQYKIRFQFSIQSFREQFAFGINTTIANTLKTVNENIYANVIGKRTSVVQTGYYSQSIKVMNVPVLFFYSLIDSTFFPVMSQIAEPDEFRKKITMLNKGTLSIILIVFTLLIPISEEIIYILLGEKWLGASWTLTMLFTAGLFITWGNIGRNLIKCLGRTFLILKYEVFIFLVSMSVLSIASRYGYKAMVIAFVCVAIFKALIIQLLANKAITANMLNTIKQLIPLLICCIFCVLANLSISINNLILSLLLKTAFSLIVLTLFVFSNQDFRSFFGSMFANKLIIKK